MANEDSDFADAYADQNTRSGGPSLADYDYPVRYRRVNITITEAANASGDYYDLGPALFEGEVIPWLSGLRYKTGSTGTLNTTFTLSKADTAGTVTDLTGLATGNGTVWDVFADFAAATTLPTVTATDELRLYLTTVTTATADRTVEVWVAYAPKHGV